MARIGFGWMSGVPARRMVGLAALLLVSALLAVRIVDPVPLLVLPQQVLDAFQRAAPRREGDFPAVVVDIDDVALRQYGQWPWPRDRMARLLERIFAGGPAGVALDILFAESDRLSWAATAERLAPHASDVSERLRGPPSTDSEFAAAMRDRPVVLARVPLLASLPGGRAVEPTGTSIAELGGSAVPFLPSFPDALASLPELEAAAAGRGSIGLPPAVAAEPRPGAITR